TDSGPAAPPPGARKNTDDPLPKPRPLAVELDTPDPDCTADNVTSSLLTYLSYSNQVLTQTLKPCANPKAGLVQRKNWEKGTGKLGVRKGAENGMGFQRLCENQRIFIAGLQPAAGWAVVSWGGAPG